MKFYGFYNWKSAGTEQITGISAENIPSSEEVLSQNPNVLFSGQFSNLSRVLIHVRLEAFRSDGSTTLHKHDIRAYESLDLRNVPLRSIGIFVPPSTKIGFHGMGVFTLPEDEDEKAVAFTKSSIFESLRQSPNFDTDVYTKSTITTATDTTIMTPSTDTSLGLYKLNISCAGAQTVEIKWSDSDGTGGFEVIGLYRFASEGTYTMDFDVAMLRNPNGQNGLLLATTSTTASTQIDCIGHYIQASQ